MIVSKRKRSESRPGHNQWLKKVWTAPVRCEWFLLPPAHWCMRTQELLASFDYQQRERREYISGEINAAAWFERFIATRFFSWIPLESGVRSNFLVNPHRDLLRTRVKIRISGLVTVAPYHQLEYCIVPLFWRLVLAHKKSFIVLLRSVKKSNIKDDRTWPNKEIKGKHSIIDDTLV